MFIFASSEVSTTEPSLWRQIASQPFIVSLLLVVTLFVMYFYVTHKLGLSLLVRLLGSIPIMLFLAVFYFSEGPFIATILLSVGFLLSFALVFLDLSGAGKK